MKTRLPTAPEDSANETVYGYPFGNVAGGLPCIECPARTSDLCGALSDKNLPILFKASTLIELGKGDTLFSDDQPAEHIFNVISGTITVFRMGPSGQRQVVNFLFTGDLLGITPEDHYGFWPKHVRRRFCVDGNAPSLKISWCFFLPWTANSG